MVSASGQRAFDSGETTTQERVRMDVEELYTLGSPMRDLVERGECSGNLSGSANLVDRNCNLAHDDIRTRIAEWRSRRVAHVLRWLPADLVPPEPRLRSRPRLKGRGHFLNEYSIAVIAGFYSIMIV